MEQMRMNRGWRFYHGEDSLGAYKGLDDSAWKSVTLPHDWAVEHPFDRKNSSGTGYLPGGIGWYRNRFVLPEDIQGKHVSIRFDGVYQNSRVYINGNYLGMRPYGYSTFSYDISEFVVVGDNVVAVRVEHIDLADSRWYTGNGIYRDVTLRIANPIHFAEYGVFVKTKAVEADAAALAVEWQLAGGAADVRFTVLNACGEVCGKGTATGTCGEVEISVSSPALWSPENPALYTLRCEAYDGDDVLDSEDITFGIRTFAFDVDKGFTLNGVNMKLKGLCIHHDAGTLGAAVPPHVWARRLRKFREAGCNAIRFSHNPPDPRLLDLCDSMGFLTIDEAFDEWEGCKNKWWQGHNVYPPKHFGYYDAFPMWHEADLAAMVRRDRNHPSIILWSIGNEVDYPNDPYVHPLFETMTGNNDANKPAAERQYDANKPNAERLTSISKMLCAIVKQHDATRPVTAALAFPELSNLTGFASTLDVVGYNYKEHLYADDHAKYPSHVIFGSENSKRTEDWLAVKNNDYICGQFLWTGIDFMGEAHGWPIRISMAGIMTMAGFEKPLYAHRKALWTDTPYARLATGFGKDIFWETFAWDYQDGQMITVSCYTNAQNAELFLNGRSFGIKTLAEADGGRAAWEVPYEKGELRVVCDGGASCDALYSTGEVAEIRLKADKTLLMANGEDGCQIEVELFDAQGHPVATHDLQIAYALVGGAEILGIENGDPKDLVPYTSRVRSTYRGEAVVYLRAGEQTDSLTLYATADNGLRAELRLEQRS